LLLATLLLVSWILQNEPGGCVPPAVVKNRAACCRQMHGSGLLLVLDQRRLARLVVAVFHANVAGWLNVGKTLSKFPKSLDCGV
jgi:hypothetical protein